MEEQDSTVYLKKHIEWKSLWLLRKDSHSLVASIERRKKNSPMWEGLMNKLSFLEKNHGWWAENSWSGYGYHRYPLKLRQFQ